MDNNRNIFDMQPTKLNTSFLLSRPLQRLPGLFISLACAISIQAGEIDAPIAVEEKPEPWFTPKIDIRGRYEYADEEFRDVSNAWTLRTRAGLLSKKFRGFQGYAEYEGTLAADREGYRAASVSGPPNKTVIADPESHELNELWLSYDGFEAVDLKAGRQGINLDNQRYVGTVAWRQNMQTFDAAGITITPLDDLEVYYAYVDRVNRIFGSGDIENPAQRDFYGNTSLLHAAYKGLPIGTLKVFAYFMDLHNDAGDVNSNNSYGASLEGPFFDEALDYYLEYGYQTDGFDNPRDYKTHYFHGKLTAKVGGPHKIAAGYEYLGSDDRVGYNFPLGTNHAFNGYADVFLVTPPDGLQDAYLSYATDLPWGIKGGLYFHHFWNANGRIDFGNEYDAVLSKPITRNATALVKYAYYDGGSDPRYREIHRLAAQIELKF